MKGGSQPCTSLPVEDKGIPGRGNSKSTVCQGSEELQSKQWDGALGLTGRDLSNEVGEIIKDQIIWGLLGHEGLWIYAKCDGNSLENVPLFDFPF